MAWATLWSQVQSSIIIIPHNKRRNLLCLPLSYLNMIALVWMQVVLVPIKGIMESLSQIQNFRCIHRLRFNKLRCRLWAVEFPLALIIIVQTVALKEIMAVTQENSVWKIPIRSHLDTFQQFNNKVTFFNPNSHLSRHQLRHPNRMKSLGKHGAKWSQRSASNCQHLLMP